MKTKRRGVVYLDKAAGKLEYEKLAREWLVLRERKHYAGGDSEYADEYVVGLTIRMIELRSKMNGLIRRYGDMW